MVSPRLPGSFGARASAVILLTAALAGCQSGSDISVGPPVPEDETAPASSSRATEEIGRATQSARETSSAMDQRATATAAAATLSVWDSRGELPSPGLGFTCEVDSEGKPRCDLLQEDAQGDLVDCATGQAASGGGVDIKAVSGQIYRTSDEGWQVFIWIFIDPVALSSMDGMSVEATGAQGTFRILAQPDGSFDDQAELTGDAVKSVYVNDPGSSFLQSMGSSMEIGTFDTWPSADEAAAKLHALLDGLQVAAHVGAVCDTFPSP